MESLDEKELNALLHQWEAPDAPVTLGRRVLPRPRSWWQWLWSGTIRIPVPAGIAAIVLVGFWIYYAKGTAPVPAARPAISVSLADFQPVTELEPQIVRIQQ